MLKSFKLDIFRNFSRMATLETLKFDNLALKTLPIDKEKKNYVRTVNAACFSRVEPVPVIKPELVAYSESCMALIDLKRPEIDRHDFVQYFSGNKILKGSEVAAHCYCGHQFGHFAGQLGDGAAMYLGEVINHNGERWEIQLKGAGPTPYSRQADGRKVLRSSIREFLCSEAMHHLGVPTTRAGSCITSSTFVERDMFYDGHSKNERCTIVLRMAPTFIRFGSFEIFKTMDYMSGRVGPSVGKTEILKKLLEYSISTFFPQIHASNPEPEARYEAFFKDVVLKTALLVAKWQSVGFCHGVLNTDNMSILGLTLDYGPYGFLDHYDPDHICNSSDDSGRYTYIRQPEICLWNLKKFAEALSPLLPLNKSLPILNFYSAEFELQYLTIMRKKLGLINPQSGDSDLIKEFFDMLENCGGDFTNSFRLLNVLLLPTIPGHGESREILVAGLIKQCLPLCRLQSSISNIADERHLQLMVNLMASNPEMLERFGKSVSQLLSELKKIEKTKKLMGMNQEKKDAENATLINTWVEKYCKRLESEFTTDFSLKQLLTLQQKRVNLMNRHNPKFILRNYIAQTAIEHAEKGDYSQVKEVLKKLETPYAEEIDIAAAIASCSTSEGPSCNRPRDQEDLNLPPEWSQRLKVSCSS